MNYKHTLNIDLLFQILEIQSTSGECVDMQAFIWEYAESRGWVIDCDDVGNLYITKGRAVNFPCVVAHLDTVHRIHSTGSIEVVRVGSDRLTGINPSTMKQTGIGGDDKCGIYSALECLNHLDYCKAAFFVDEEIGCVGSHQCNIDFFYDVRFILQSDRRGNSDFITDICGPISSTEFQDAVAPYLTKYNFRKAYGMMTDVEALRDLSVGVSCANISSGYYNPHQDSEYISMRDLQNTTNLMIQICEELHDVYSFIAPPRPLYRESKSTKNYWYDDAWDSESPTKNKTLAFVENLEKKYGDSPFDDDPNITQMDFHDKKILEMTDAEWIEFNNRQTELEDELNRDVENSIRDELSELDQWFYNRNQTPHNPLV